MDKEEFALDFVIVSLVVFLTTAAMGALYIETITYTKLPGCEKFASKEQCKRKEEKKKDFRVQLPSNPVRSTKLLLCTLGTAIGRRGQFLEDMMCSHSPR